MSKLISSDNLNSALNSFNNKINSKINEKENKGHTHNYAGSSSVGGAANSVKTKLTIKLNNGTTEGTNLFTFNGSAAKTINITPASIGAAISSHGTHVGDALSSTAAKANGTAAAGTSSKVAREDHVHPLQTTVSGNAGTATKLKTARNITIGNKTNSFDGSGAISFSLSDIGAAPSSHTHNVLSVKSDNYKKNTDLPSTYERGETLFFTNNPAEDGKFNGLTYGLVQTLKEYSSGSAAWQFLYPYNDGNQDKFYVRSAKLGTDSWRSWAQVYTSLNKPTPADIGALPLSGGTLTGRLHADGKLSVKARGGSWIDTVNFDNVAIANNTEPGSEGSYYPLLAARTDGGHTISLGSNYTNFGFYGFKKGRTENNVDLQFTFDVNAHSTYTNTWMNVDNGMEVTQGIDASLFRPRYAPGSQNCYIGGGSGDAADWDSHNMVIRSHWGIGFHDYENACRIVFCTRSGNINTRGLLYSEGGVSTTQWIHANGSLSADGGATIGGHTYINAMSVSDKITGETKFSQDGAWGDPWEGIGCAIKAHGHIATNYTVKAGYLNVPQGEFNGWPSGSDSFIKVRTEHDGNGQGDGVTHLGYNNGDGYHHFFRGTGAMHVNMHQGLQISNDFIYLAGIPLTISGSAPSRGGVWIQI